MIVSVCKLFLILPSRSLKDKRRIVRSLTEKAASRFRISVSEVDSNDVPATAVIGMSSVSSESRHANNIIDRAIEFIQAERPDIEMMDVERETLTGF